jgi:CheY-like chemotaxis protein
VGALIRTSVGKPIRVKLRLTPHPPIISGDEVELQQMIMNLCLNARDAMPDGGDLVIETSPLTADQRAKLSTGDDHTIDGVCLVVKDSGEGIPPEALDRIFEPFFTTKDDTTQKGTGLGLAMVYGIVRRHGGTIDVYSRTGVGTSFEILLPAAAPGDGAEEPGGRRILVVDDEPAFREMIQLILEEDGYRVHLAANGMEALRMLRSSWGELALVILDLRMPGIDGLGVLDEIRGLSDQLPVLITSGYAGPEEKEEALRRGAAKVLEKPYRVAELRAALAEIFTGGLIEAGEAPNLPPVSPDDGAAS